MSLSSCRWAPTRPAAKAGRPCSIPMCPPFRCVQKRMKSSMKSIPFHESARCSLSHEGKVFSFFLPSASGRLGALLVMKSVEKKEKLRTLSSFSFLFCCLSASSPIAGDELLADPPVRHGTPRGGRSRQVSRAGRGHQRILTANRGMCGAILSSRDLKGGAQQLFILLAKHLLFAPKGNQTLPQVM